METKKEIYIAEQYNKWKAWKLTTIEYNKLLADKNYLNNEN